MKLFKSTALIALFLVENALSFTGISTALKHSTNNLQKQWRLKVVPRPDTYTESKKNLELTVPGFLAESNLIYGYATLRSLVKEYDRVVRKGVPARDKGGLFGWGAKDKELLDFDTPALVLTQGGAQVRGRLRYLKYDITPAAILKFLELNRNLIKGDGAELVIEKIDGEHPPSDFEKDLKRLIARKIDARITEFDDEFSGAELVYGITQDVTNKRITVVFRGSVTSGKDWPTNLNMIYTKVPVPPLLKNVPLNGYDIKVHRGFYGYLHSTGEGTPKINEIVTNLKEVLAENPGYELFITGHSLGGALCQLLSFELASYGEVGEKDVFPLPIRAISFASPQIGNKMGYAKCYEALEKAGRVRHLRVTNDGDVVPEGPAGFGYTQTGINVHVKEAELAGVGYNVVKSIMGQAGFNSLDMHSLDQYRNRFFIPENKESILVKEIDDLYQSEADILHE